ncbi:MAG: alpha/beta fold hydrolase [Betaproteobacteria bacterium]|nr:alpha/beta fold hydrolase [Betaproteobacteria bacterium]
MAQRFVDRMAVEVDGDGEAVVLLHGLGGTSNTWTPLMPALVRHRAVRVDLPGSGRSQRAYALDHGPLSIDAMADSVMRVCGALGIERAWLAGHSLGTIVCAHVAVREPKWVRGLFLLGPLLAPPDPARAAITQRAAKARAEGMAGIADALVQATLASHTRQSAPVAVAAVRESLMGQDPEGYARTCEALAEAKAADVAALDVPVLLVTGDEDPVAPPQSVRAMGSRFPKARVEVLARCGHWTTFEKPAECQSLLGDFLRSAR